MADTHRNVATHPVSLTSGRTLAPAEAGSPDLDDAHDQALVDDGSLIPVHKQRGTTAEKKED